MDVCFGIARLIEKANPFDIVNLHLCIRTANNAQMYFQHLFDLFWNKNFRESHSSRCIFALLKKIQEDLRK